MKKDDYLQMSGIQHFAFCKRQWGLIHIDGIWVDNELTASGNIIHKSVDSGTNETRKDLRILRSLNVTSNTLKLNGRCDVVEIHRLEDEKIRIFPVEYKRGRPKKCNCDRVQLCAQAIALEEMFNAPVENGAIYYHSVRRREDVTISKELRILTRKLSEEMHEYFQKGTIPAPEYGPQCMSCSLYERCLPKTVSSDVSVKRYMKGKRKSI